VNGRILVAGATSRVGSAAVRHLLHAGFEVRALVRSVDKGRYLRALDAEVVIGDVTNPGSLASAVIGCSGVYSALAARHESASEVEYRGNLNLLSAAEEAGVLCFVYSSAPLRDHPLAQRVSTFREKWRFEEVLLRAKRVAPTILRPAMFMETLLMALRGPFAFISGPQQRPISWISASDVALAATRAFERSITGRHELTGPDRETFDSAYGRLARVQERKIQVLHPPLALMRVPGLVLDEVRELANMFALFDAAGYAADPTPLRERFEVQAQTFEEWARGFSAPGLR
jgi:uncharacterized protein YbjT (DUF2867 family)